MRVRAVQILYLILGLLLLASSNPALATEYNSTNFKVRDPDINVGGNQATASTQLSAPGAPILIPTTGGILAANTYYYKITALDGFGETQGGTEALVVVGGASNAVSASWTAVSGASSYRIYRGTSAGGENTYYTSSTNSFTDTGAAGTSGTPPTSNTTGAKGAGTTGQEVIGQSTSTTYVVKAGFQYFDQTIPNKDANCDGNAVPVCDGSTYGTETTTTSSVDTLSANWSNNGTSALFSDAESGIYSYDYSIKRTSDGFYWSGTNWTSAQTRFNTRSLTVTVTGLTLQAGLTYQFVIRAVNGGGLYTADYTSPGITVQPALTLTINGVAAGQTIKGSIQTNVATDGLTLNFGTLTFDQSALAAHDLTIATNSSQGYFVRVRVDRQLTCDACTGTPTISAFSGTNDAPVAWGTNNGFGYTTNNRKATSLLSLDPTGRFSAADTWSGFVTTSATTNAAEISYNAGPETATTRIGYQIRVSGSQTNGTYNNQIIYLATATY